MRVILVRTPGKGGYGACTGHLLYPDTHLLGSNVTPMLQNLPLAIYPVCKMYGGNERQNLLEWPANDWFNLRVPPGEGTHAQHCLDDQEPEAGRPDT